MLKKSRASEILSGLRIAPSERRHAKSAVESAKGITASALEVNQKIKMKMGSSELRISDISLGKSSKTGK